MAAVANGNTKRYSWWWDSHISPKNSKWLQENLTDMDSNVKKMIKVIEEDADSFARRAEMYYKKRPELMKLVEEFYRAYRALAERYDHATGVIRHAQKTMAEAFPNQDPMMFGEDSLVGSSTDEFDPNTPESYPPIRAPVYPNEFQKESFGSSFSHMSTVKRNIAFMEEGQGLKTGKARKGLNFNDDGYGRNAKVLSESEHASKAEAEIVALKDALSKVQAEKEASLAKFDQNLERLTTLESEVSHAQEDSKGFSERATKAEADVESLRDSLGKLEVEKGSCLLQYQQCLQNVADLEERISLAQKEAGEVNERASQAEAETVALKQSLVISEIDKEAALVQYQQCLETISNLEEKLHKAEEDARLINQRAEHSDGEVESLKQKVSKLVEENEAYELQYQQCLDTIADLKLKLFHAQEETKRLSREIEDGVAKLKSAEDKCVVLERSNQNLHTELDGLLDKLGNQSHELTEKQKEMGKLWTSVQEEHSRFMEAETAFQTLQQLHSQSQEELNTLAIELQNRSQILKDLEARNNDLQEEVEEAKAESNNLSELNISSAASIKILQEEVTRLREKIQKLEAEVELRVDQRNALQQEIYCLKEELSQIGKKHQSMVEQVELVGLHPERFGSSVKELQEENSVLKETKERESIEKTVLLEKLEMMEKLVQKNLLLENSISDLNSELEIIRGKLKTLEESCISLAEEKLGLNSEKDMLISRLQSATENSNKLSEENRLLENSLFDANAELEELKSELKRLEDSCHLLNDDKASLVSERESLLSDMDIMRKIIQDLEKEQAVLKLKVLELAAERVSSLQRIEELGVALDSKDREYASFALLSESRINGMDSKIHLLKDENQRQEREYQMELDRAHNAHVEIIVLQKCLQDWLEKSSSLVAENQKIKEASQLLEKLVSELEHENIGKQAQIESSINCIKILRMGIYQVLMKLEINPGIDSGDENSHDQTNTRDILSKIDDMQTMLLKIQKENQQSAIEKLVLVEFLRQLKQEAVGIAREKKILEKELESQSHQLSLSRDESQKLVYMNGELTTKVNQGINREEVLKVKIEDYHMHSAIENIVLVELISQLESEAVGIATEKNTLEEELESHSHELLFSRDETHKLIHVNGELITKVSQGVNREEVLKEKIEDMHMQSAIGNIVLVELIRQLKSDGVVIATEKTKLEEELELQSHQLLFSRDETHKLIDVNGELTTKVNQGVNREEVLKVEIEDLHRQVLHFRNDYTTLQGENSKTLDEKRYFAEWTLRLEEEKRKLEEDISFLLSETIYQSNLIFLLEEVVLEKLSGAMKLNEDLDRLIFAKCKLEEEAREVSDELKSTEIENLRLEVLLEKTDSELLSARSANHHLEHEIANVKDQLVRKEKELVEAMLMISIAQKEKSELSKAVEDLQCRYKETKAIEEDKEHQVLKLRGDYDKQIKKTSHADEAILKLEANLMSLLMELDGIKEEKEKLNLELLKERNENELWESQSSTLFGDLQISAVRETLLQGFTRELAEAGKSLENKSTLKDSEIDQLKVRVNSLEDANKEQNDLMSKHAQAVVLLKESVDSLEKHFAMPQQFENEPSKDTASEVYNNDGFLELQELRLRIKAIDEAVTEKLAMKELKATGRRSRRRSGSLRKQNHEIYSEESEMITKDIILDQVSDCSSYGIISRRDLSKVEDDQSLDVKPPQNPQKGKSLSEESLVVDKLEISDRFMDPNREINKRKVLERLGSDLQKLANLHVAVEDLKTKVEKEEKGEKGGKENEYETVKEQINEAEDALEKLLSINRKLVTKVQSGFERSDGSKSSMDLDETESSRRRRISEQARRGSEKIGRLQLEIQRLQFLLHKLERGREDRAKAKTSDSKTRILLRDYIYAGVRGERRKRMKKRFAFCSCVQPPPPSP